MKSYTTNGEAGLAVPVTVDTCAAMFIHPSQHVRTKATLQLTRVKQSQLFVQPGPAKLDSECMLDALRQSTAFCMC